MSVVVLIRGVKSRPLYNQDDIVGELRERGINDIRIVTIEEWVPYTDQVENFAAADLVVSVHGSHLNNQVFMPEHGTLIEVFPVFYYHGEQRIISKSTGVGHIELRNNEYPPVEYVKDPYHLRLLQTCKDAAADFPTPELCWQENGCRRYQY
ncbi:hypothetical protein OIV83_004237 [Microbotryomycetes sp. JL201]|nr:hypothetical protein OIV83_004237 [Microbotryomycetes sp. JL201]